MTETAVVIEESVTSEAEQGSARAEQVALVIKNHLFMSVGLGIVPIPLVDLAGFMAVQYDMAKKIAKIYDVDFSQERVRSIVIALLGSILPVAVTGTAASLLKFIPVIGPFATSITVGSLGGACTYAIGRVLVQHFETGGTLLDFDAEKMREHFKREFEIGKKTLKATK